MAKKSAAAKLAAARDNAAGPLARERSKKSGLLRTWLLTGGVILASFEAATVAFAAKSQIIDPTAWHIGPVYLPFQIVSWAMVHGAQFPDALKIAMVAGGGVFMGGAALIAATKKRDGFAKEAKHFLYGSARWANKFDIEQAGFFGSAGIYLGSWIDKETGDFYFLRHDGAQHTICFGPTRSGKGIGPVLTTLWGCDHSVVINDPKGELSQKAGPHRETNLNNIVLYLELASPHCRVSWNPFEEIRVGTEDEIADVQNICGAFVDTSGAGFDDGSTEAFFRTSARDYLIGVVLHGLYQHLSGRRVPFKDAAGQPVAKIATEDQTLSFSVDGLVSANGAPLASVVGDRTFRKGEPLPKVRADRCVHSLKVASINVTPYETEVFYDETREPRFAHRHRIVGKEKAPIPIDYEYEILTHFEAAPPPSPASIGRMLVDADADAGALLEEMLTAQHFPVSNPDFGVGPDKRTHRIVAQEARKMIALGTSDQQKGVMSSVTTLFGLYDDVNVARNTSRSSFKVQDLMYSQRPVSLFISTQEKDKDRLRPLTRVLYALIVRNLTDKQVYVEGKLVTTFNHRLLFHLDEFPDLGRIPAIESILATAAGFGLKFMFFCQNLPQLLDPKSYGENEKITGACAVKVFFTPADDKTAEFIMPFTGETTVTGEQISITRKAGMFGSDQTETRSSTEAGRPLMTKNEIMTMPTGVYAKDNPTQLVEPGDTLIHTTGRPMIYGTQILYWREPYFEMANAMKMPPRVNYARVPWRDRFGARRYSLMPVAEAEALAEQLRDDPEGTQPPMGVDATWIVEGEKGHAEDGEDIDVAEPGSVVAVANPALVKPKPLSTKV